MSGSEAKAASLESVLITDELARRTPAAVPRERVDAALKAISKHIAKCDPRALMQGLTDSALSVCAAGTGGFSILERQADDSELFRWDALSGALAQHVGGTTPRDWSPCGVTLDRKAPQLFYHPARFFTYFNAAQPAIVEGLVLPLWLEHGVALGTLWVATHTEEQKFTRGDVEAMASLCAFAGAAARVLGIRPRVAQERSA